VKFKRKSPIIKLLCLSKFSYIMNDYSLGSFLLYLKIDNFTVKPSVRKKAFIIYR
jgi:hypothetical protein